MNNLQLTINAQTQLYGILGNPVRHSLSPMIHNSLFEKLKINAVYLAFEIEKNSLGLAFEAMRGMGMRGANITIPFKEEAVNFIDEIPEDVDRRIGAINTVVNRDGGLFGYNTDMAGFLMALKEELGFNPEGKKILVLGAGGAARAVVFALARTHADQILIHNRSEGRAEGLSDYVSEYFHETEIDVIPSLDLADEMHPDLVVNATSSGMKEPDVAPMDLRALSRPVCVYDLIYSPIETEFLKQAKTLGWPRTNGLGMLAAQAALSFELWTGKKEGVREDMLEELKKCYSL